MDMKAHLTAWAQQTDDTLVEVEYLESVARSVDAAFALRGAPEQVTRIRLDVLATLEDSFVRAYVGRFRTNPDVARFLAVSHLSMLVDRYVSS